jgi:hypothetical protein
MDDDQVGRLHIRLFILVIEGERLHFDGVTQVFEDTLNILSGGGFLFRAGPARPDLVGQRLQVLGSDLPYSADRLDGRAWVGAGRSVEVPASAVGGASGALVVGAAVASGAAAWVTGEAPAAMVGTAGAAAWPWQASAVDRTSRNRQNGTTIRLGLSMFIGGEFLVCQNGKAPISAMFDICEYLTSD